MSVELAKRKTIFANGIPKYTRPITEYKTAMLGKTLPGTGTYVPLPYDPSKSKYTPSNVRKYGTAQLVLKMQQYPYEERRNDILTIGDSRGDSQKYPPPFLRREVGQEYHGQNADDRFVRGGFVMSTERALIDVARLGHWMTTPTGLLWNLREAGMQLTNARPETRLFNPTSLLLTAAGQHLGIRFARHGLFSEIFGGPATYGDIRDYRSYGMSLENAPFLLPVRPSGQPKLMDLTSELFLGKPTFSLSIPSLTEILGALTGESIAKQPFIPDRVAGGFPIRTLNYLGAVNSTYGGLNLLGSAIHRSYNTLVNMAGDFTYRNPQSDRDVPLLALAKLAKEAPRMLQGESKDKKTTTGALDKLASRAQTSALPLPHLTPLGAGVSPVSTLMTPLGVSALAPSEELLKRYQTLSYGELAKTEKQYISPTREELIGPSDGYKLSPKLSSRIKSKRKNLLWQRGMSDPGNPSVSTFDGTNSVGPTTGLVHDNPYDLVPLVFYDVTNDVSVVFRAVVEGIADTYAPQWSEYKYVGNPQSFGSYTGTTRDMAFTFYLFPDSERELRWNWMKLNRFVSMAHPSYAKAGYMIGPFLRLTLADMLHAMPGYMTHLAITVDDKTPWEINLFDDPNLAKLPHLVQCDVSYRVVYDESLGPNTKFYLQNKLGSSPWTFDDWGK